jgi:hypothetical protein
MIRPLLLLSLSFALSACIPEIRIGADEGIPPIAGFNEVPIEGFTCGQPINAGVGTTTTRVVPGGCELSIVDDIQVIDDSDYSRNSDLARFSGLLEAVELNLTEFSFIDATTNVALDPATRITSATLAINGQQVADKGTLTALPQTLRLTGVALQPLIDAISRRQPASLRVDAVIVLPDDPPPPKALRFQYQAQPTLVLGGSVL